VKIQLKLEDLKCSKPLHQTLGNRCTQTVITCKLNQVM